LRYEQAEVIAMKSHSKVFLIVAALIVGSMTVAVAPTASAQVHISGSLPLPHGGISFNVGDHGYYRGGYGGGYYGGRGSYYGGRSHHRSYRRGYYDRGYYGGYGYRPVYRPYPRRYYVPAPVVVQPYYGYGYGTGYGYGGGYYCD
jgi:hypothetical protein